MERTGSDNVALKEQVPLAAERETLSAVWNTVWWWSRKRRRRRALLKYK